jgi:hypothetical protein
MSDVETLINSHTREELDQIAQNAGVEDPQSLDTKADVAEAIVATDGEAETQNADLPVLPGQWQWVQAGPDYFSAERYVESLGLQKVSEGGVTAEEVVGYCEAYDAHQDALGEEWPNKATTLTGVQGTNG